MMQNARNIRLRPRPKEKGEERVLGQMPVFRRRESATRVTVNGVPPDADPVATLWAASDSDRPVFCPGNRPSTLMRFAAGTRGK